MSEDQTPKETLKRMFRAEQIVDNFNVRLAEKSIKHFDENREILAHLLRVAATMVHMKYEAFLKAGFDEQQALYLASNMDLGEGMRKNDD